MSVNLGVSGYRAALLDTVKSTPLDKLQWGNERWKALWPRLDDNVLNDAFNQHGLVCSIFSELGEISQRKCKSMTRIEKKKEEQEPGEENFFKVVSDFIAIRVYCDVEQIEGKIDYIKEIVLKEKGKLYIKGSSIDQPYGGFKASDCSYTDIVQYVFVFMEAVGHLIEFQIGHKFAAHTFTIDSELRDNKKCDKVDLWDDDFYLDVREYILNKSNKKAPESKDLIEQKGAAIHKGAIPGDLQAILDEI